MAGISRDTGRHGGYHCADGRTSVNRVQGPRDRRWGRQRGAQRCSLTTLLRCGGEGLTAGRLPIRQRIATTGRCDKHSLYHLGRWLLARRSWFEGANRPLDVLPAMSRWASFNRARSYLRWAVAQRRWLKRAHGLANVIPAMHGARLERAWSHSAMLLTEWHWLERAHGPAGLLRAMHGNRLEGSWAPLWWLSPQWHWLKRPDLPADLPAMRRAGLVGPQSSLSSLLMHWHWLEGAHRPLKVFLAMHRTWFERPRSSAHIIAAAHFHKLTRIG
mmetsp:Transcript_54375/g.99996  ORF Transcript_54375/g.99996 Transcript_54375/m.99996 type:complete len:273 (-) Transcript_54375:1521-2339(-)